jgi:predicted Zn finger-like uncharacterized protein
MRIICPKCDVGFSVPDKAIPEAGRKLRCSQCAHTWHQMRIEEAPVEKAEVEPGTAEDFGFMKVGSGEAPPPEPSQAEDAAPEDEADEDDSGLRERVQRRAMSAGMAAGSMAKKGAKRVAIALGVMALMVLMPLGVIMARETVVSFWEPSALLFEKLGMPIKVAGDGLVIQNFGASQRVEGELRVLQVKGEIRNNTEMVIAIPTLKGTATDVDGHPLQNWLFRTDAEMLLPGEIKDFEAEFADPPLGTKAVMMGFSKLKLSGGLGY